MLIALIIAMAVCGAYVAVHWWVPLRTMRRWTQNGSGAGASATDGPDGSPTSVRLRR